MAPLINCHQEEEEESCPFSLPVSVCVCQLKGKAQLDKINAGAYYYKQRLISEQKQADPAAALLVASPSA